LEKRIGASVELIRSSGGVFEVVAEGKLVHSKRATGEFPDEEALVDTLGG
jgi:selenoprotein W-related protein